MISEYQNRTQEYFRYWKKKKEDMSIKLNSFLDQMRDTEREVKMDDFTIPYEKMNYDDCIINNDEWKKRMAEKFSQKNEDNALEKRKRKFEDVMSENEMLSLEKLCGRYVDKIVFNSNETNWGKNSSTFYNSVQSKSHLLVLMETNNREKI